MDRIELSLKRNARVQVIQKHINGAVVRESTNAQLTLFYGFCTGWWFVKHEDRTGFVPGAFLEPVEAQSSAQDAHRCQTSIRAYLNVERSYERLVTDVDDIFVVNQTYQAASRDEISLDQGSFVTVLEKSFTGWWLVK